MDNLCILMMAAGKGTRMVSNRAKVLHAICGVPMLRLIYRAAASLEPDDIAYVNAHGTSTPKGDRVEIECLREVFGKRLTGIPVSSNKSQIGHTLGAAAAIEAALGIEGMQRGLILPTVNHIPDPELEDVDVVPNVARKCRYEFFLSNAFGFGGTNCCIVFRGV